MHARGRLKISSHGIVAFSVINFIVGLWLSVCISEVSHTEILRPFQWYLYSFM